MGVQVNGSREAHRFSKVLGAQGREEAPIPPVIASNPKAQIGGQESCVREMGRQPTFRHRCWEEKDNLFILMLSG